MNEFFVFLLIFGISIWLVNKPVDIEEYGTNVMQGQLKKLWQDAFQNMMQNNVGRAERSLLALLKLDSRNTAAYNRLGIIYARQGLKKEAVECFEISSSLSSNASAYHNLALAYLYDSKHEKAIRAFEHAIEKEPENPTRYLALARILEKRGEDRAAIKELEKAHRMAPGDKSSEMLAQLYRKIDKHDLAGQVENESKLLKAIAK